MAAPSEGIKDLLVGALIGQFNQTNATWPIYISKLPAESDQCIAIFDTGGRDPDPKWLLDYPDVTVMVRAKGYTDCNTKTRNIASKLNGLFSQVINGDRWNSLVQQGGIINAGRDDKDRQLMTVTFRLIIEPASDAFTNRQPL